MAANRRIASHKATEVLRTATPLAEHCSRIVEQFCCNSSACSHLHSFLMVSVPAPFLGLLRGAHTNTPPKNSVALQKSLGLMSKASVEVSVTEFSLRSCRITLVGDFFDFWKRNIAGFFRTHKIKAQTFQKNFGAFFVRTFVPRKKYLVPTSFCRRATLALSNFRRPFQHQYWHGYAWRLSDRHSEEEIKPGQSSVSEDCLNSRTQQWQYLSQPHRGAAENNSHTNDSVHSCSAVHRGHGGGFKFTWP